MKCFNSPKMRLVFIGFAIVIMLAGIASANVASVGIEITILYDNYTVTEGCTASWGFSCMITGTEKNILFDAGTSGNILLGNMDKLGIRAQDAELVVISHNHGDHTGNWQSPGGLLSFLGRNNNVSVYLPPSVSSEQVQLIEAAGASAQIVNDSMKLCDRVHLTGPMHGPAIEQALVLDTPKGLVVIAGCAHPGVVQIIEKAKQMLNKDVYFIFGGFHLLDDSDSQIMSKIEQLKSLGVRKCGASHCTGDRAIELFKQEYGPDVVSIGVGPVSIPVVYDLNTDSIVDAADVCIIVDHWKTDEPSCDFVPGLFGDGIVDIQDLIALAEHLFEDYRLMAHWKLDETEGIIAYESIDNKDATCHGEPIWQPDGGKVGGALQFNGIDDYVSTPFVLNPGEVSFSATAWIRGGAPGQVIISQADVEGQSAIESGSTWLGINPSDGRLMTGLMDIFFGPLESESVVTDEQWYQVGLVYDHTAMKRHLYVDGTEVAIDDSIVAGVQSTAGLYIGAGQTLDASSFFSGMIDDVRIYNKALSAEEITALAK